MMRKKILLLLLLLGTAIMASPQQVDAVSQSNPKRAKADSLLDRLQFVQALGIYDELVKEYPNDPHIQYPLGICYLMGTRNMDKAVEYLAKASKAKLPNMVHFFLAQAQRQNYQFTEAVDNYRQFALSGGSRDIKAKDVEPLVALCENGSFLTRYIFTPQVLDTKTLPAADITSYYSIAPATGSFVSIPENLLTPTDKKMQHQSVIFYPKDPRPGDYLYYSSYGNATAFGKDIFRIKFQEDGLWGRPEVIGDVVNSFADDDFPYLAPDGVTLYFSSKGHYGMGGYDIYKSVYNPRTRLWSTAENLGFPFNSPYDDYLYVVGDSDSVVCFATNRSVMPDTVQLVLMKFDKEPIRRSAKSSNELLVLSRLGAESKRPAAEPQKAEKQRVADEPGMNDLRKKKPARFSSVENDPEYARVMAKGFAAQMRTDTLIAQLEKLRKGFDHIETAEERVKLERRVTKVEDDMLAAQKEADMMFVRASQIEQEYLTGKRKPQGKPDATFAVDNPEYIYQAQFASTVFQADEVDELARAEQSYPQLLKARENAFEAKARHRACAGNYADTIAPDCAATKAAMLSAMAGYSSPMEKYFEKKYAIYNDCIHVALIKSGNKDETIRNDIDASKAHVRTASAILNNLDEEGREESAFEAALMRELALLKLDLAFSKIWGLKLFDQQLVSRIIRLETSIFGISQQADPLKTPPARADAGQTTPAAPKIERQEEARPVQPIVIKQAAPSDFAVLDEPVYNADNPIPLNSPLPGGVVYRIQIGAFGTPRQPQFFKGMTPVFAETAGSLTKYSIGNLTAYPDAEKALGVVKSKGFKDAFIVAWYNGKKVTPQRAQSLEGSARPTARPEVANSGKIYKIQLGTYDSELPESVSRTVRAVASEKEITRTDSGLGSKEFFVGTYSTLEEAQRVKDNLVASGIVSAVVVTVELDKK